MKLIPDKNINFICCDLPYGSTKNHWDIVIPFEELSYTPCYKYVELNN